MTQAASVTSSRSITDRPGASDAASYKKWWVDAWRPSTREDNYRMTDVRGEIPREIRGTLYRNGPSQKILPEQGYESLHLFDGDGLVHAFRFEDGKVDYRGRFVRNASFLAEQREGRYCQTGFGVSAANPIDDIPIRQQPNTNVVYHGGKLMALVENAYPFEIDARTLDPIGENNFGGSMLGMSTTAHPKIDGRSGQMLIHGYQPFPPYLQLYTIEPDGRCSQAETVDAPYASMMHDFAITENYVVFPLAPIVMDAASLMSGAPFVEALRWAPELGMKLGVKRRQAGSEVRWIDVPTPGYMFHPGNAYEADGKILMDACTYLDPQALLDSLRTWRSGVVRPGFHAVPFLYEIDLAAGKVSERQLDDRACEFPRLDDRLVGHENRYGYALRSRSTVEAASEPWSVLVRYDRKGGTTSAYDFGRGRWPSEPVFVPRSANAAEDDGFIVATVYDGPDDSTFLAVLDASNLGAGPIATARLEHRIPLGFHGSFAAGVI